MLELSLVVSLVALVIAFRASARVKALTARIQHLESGQGITTPPAEAPVSAPSAAAPDAAPANTPWGRRKPLSPVPETPAPGPRPPSRLMLWLRANWIYPVAGAALVMAAIYLLQYSVERGLLSPSARIALALALGAALIAAALWLRRRWGEGDGGAALVPATLAGAGAVTLFAAILAAHHLYQMIEQPATLAALAITAALAIGLGWLLGPLLAGLGVIGGGAAPFLLVGTDTTPEGLYAYFGIVAVLGLLIDGLRRWGWVSALAVVVPMAGGLALRLGGAGPEGLALLSLGVLMLAMALPGGHLVPRAQPEDRPAVAIGWLALALALVAILAEVPAPTSLWALTAAGLGLALWCRAAPGLDRVAQAAALGLPLAVALAPFVTAGFLAVALSQTPLLPLIALALAGLVSLAHVWRSRGPDGRRWALSALAAPAAVAVALDLLWGAPRVLGAPLWAGAAMGLAAYMTALAGWWARQDAGQGLRVGAAATGALAMIALSLFTLLGGAALSLALAVVMLAAAALDRQRNLPELGVLVGLGTLVLSWRLIADPGLGWLFSPTTPALDVWLTLAAVIAGPAGAGMLLAPLAAQRIREWGRVLAETGMFSLLAVAVSVVIGRFLAGSMSPHAMMGVQGSVLIALAWVQGQRNARLGSTGVMRAVRRGLAVLFGLGAAACLLVGATLLSPVFGTPWMAGPVRGWPLVNDLLLAHALPAAVLALALRGAKGKAAPAGRILAALMGATWVALVLRHLWHGGAAMGLQTGIREGELYAYTLALLVAGAAALALALHRREGHWRLIALGMIGAGAAKAFLIDAAGLEGLMRAGAFLGLGLSLAGLAWLNGWVAAHTQAGDAKDP